MTNFNDDELNTIEEVENCVTDCLNADIILFMHQFFGLLIQSLLRFILTNIDV